MKQMGRAAIYKLASAAHEMELDVASGVLHRDEDGRWQIGDHDLVSWPIATPAKNWCWCSARWPMNAKVQVRTCRTCGRDYMSWSVPTVAPTVFGCAATPEVFVCYLSPLSVSAMTQFFNRLFIIILLLTAPGAAAGRPPPRQRRRNWPG